ncbi:MAG: hypothetical protein ACXVB9_00070 [Bdellovibrionota bacterium]
MSCTIFPGAYANGDPVPPLYNFLYAYWNETWTDFFKKAGSPPGSLNIENFLRHTFVIVLHKQDKVVATLSSSVFNLGATASYDHPNVSAFREYIDGYLKNERSGLCMTGEYLSVHRDYRKEIVGLSLAEVLIGILMKIFVTIDGKLALATTVRPAKVDRICKDYGYVEVGSYLKCGVDCVKLYNTQQTLREHPNPDVVKMTDRLWAKRIDKTGWLGELRKSA